jgi:outer membrane immunogenic protein
VRPIAIIVAAVTVLVGPSAWARVKTPPPPPPAAPVASWAGFYVGGTAGGAWGRFDPTTSAINPPGLEFAPSSIAAFNAAGLQSINPAGFTGGIEAGYNWQPGNVLLGVEGDLESFHLRGNANSGPLVYPCCAPSIFTVTSSASTNWLATVRGRLGYVVGDWLFFATGGAAFTTLHGTFGFSENFYVISETASVAAAKTGYTVGGGVEAKLWSQWSAKVEYLHLNFGTVTTGGLAGVGVLVFPLPLTHSMDLKADLVRLGLNYHF